MWTLRHCEPYVALWTLCHFGPYVSLDTMSLFNLLYKCSYCLICNNICYYIQAESTVLLIAGYWWMCRKAPLPPRARMAVNALLGMGILQVIYKLHFICQSTNRELCFHANSSSFKFFNFNLKLINDLFMADITVTAK